ncbi:hypothetical protein SAMN05428981_106132 [Bacillus sp. OV194]|nr:hypothetical protein SAMN05428981_106132 [Bacillus sp. OV194]
MLNSLSKGKEQPLVFHLQAEMNNLPAEMKKILSKIIKYQPKLQLYPPNGHYVTKRGSIHCRFLRIDTGHLTDCHHIIAGKHLFIHLMQKFVNQDPLNSPVFQ